MFSIVRIRLDGLFMVLLLAGCLLALDGTTTAGHAQGVCPARDPFPEEIGSRCFPRNGNSGSNNSGPSDQDKLNAIFGIGQAIFGAIEKRERAREQENVAQAYYYNERGRDFFSAGDYESAANAFQTSLSYREDSNVRGNLQKAWRLKSQKDAERRERMNAQYEAERKSAQERATASATKGYARKLNDDGIALIAKGDYEGAIQTFKTSLSYVDDPNVRKNLTKATALRDEGRAGIQEAAFRQDEQERMNSDNPAEAAKSFGASPPQTNAGSGLTCRNRFNREKNEMLKAAGQCLNQAGDLASAKRYIALVAAGEKAIPDRECRSRVSVGSQLIAFMECARTYLCGAQGLTSARNAVSADADAESEACYSAAQTASTATFGR